MTPTHSNVPSTSMINRKLLAAAVAILAVAACKDVNAPNLNAPSVDGLASSVGALASTSVGLLANLRNQAFGQVVFGSSMARDGYRFDVAEQRYTSNFVSTPIDNSNFIGAGLWTGNYNTSLTADALTAAANTSALLSAGQGAGLRGYARTMRAVAYWNVAQTRDTLGFVIQTDQAAGTLSPLRCKPGALTAIIALLDSAYTDLNTAGATFIFSLPNNVNSAFGASDVEAIKNLNRAIKAKASLYLGLIGTTIVAPVGGNAAALNAAVTALGQVSVFSTAPANFGAGFYHVFSTGAGDAVNPLYVPIGVQNIYRLDKSLVDSVEGLGTPGQDTRFTAKTIAAPGLSSPLVGFPAVPSTQAFNVYQSTTQKMALIRMEELVLLRAQANIALNNLVAAKADIDAVRGGAGLPASAAPVGVTATATLTQLLQQKRYSLMWEGLQRIVDLRAYGALSTTYRPSQVGFNVFQPVLPIPLNESTARLGVLTCTP